MNRLVERDERELTVDQAADRLSYLVLSFGLLAIVAYRNFTFGESSWDLIGLMLLGGLVGAAFRTQKRAMSRWWALVYGLGAAIALVLAAVVAFVRSG